MTAECVREFRDLEAGTLRKVGERFEVTPERLEKINGTRYGQLVREVKTRAKRAKEEE